ncbi:PREDICTED: uncharacterized protein LOC108976802 [Bactrocera latifrons]|uniref:Myb/SANT-like DNA-binding domain-containing protein n=1 Tax=Bactrocera latifrons TaxID=174628 RepID=A0A0K8ULL4_BACLA|nr:PREDICTED: uncharacterized protein LOC108976802 [Bactrocera latifrons]XP_018801699.1 PREDICTED: uncharacterized protein LOC108976802 [Bactrocera latifrons]
MAENKKRTVWTSADESELIDLWRERAEDLRHAKRNLHIYTDISVQMTHKFTPKEVHVKIRNLTQKYREEKKKVGPSGSSEWKLFDTVHQIMGLTAANNAETKELFDFVDISSSTFLPFQSTTPTASPVTMPCAVSVSEPLCSQAMPSSSSHSLSSLDSSSTSATRKRNYKGEILKMANEQNELLKTVVEVGKELTERLVNAIERQNNTTQEFLVIMKSILEKM